MGKEKTVPFNILLDYWDIEKIAHYHQEESFVIWVEGTNQTIEPKEHTFPIEIKNP